MQGNECTVKFQKIIFIFAIVDLLFNSSHPDKMQIEILRLYILFFLNLCHQAPPDLERRTKKNMQIYLGTYFVWPLPLHLHHFQKILRAGERCWFE